MYPAMPKLPFSPGYDFVGEVDQCGAGVTSIQPGTRVVGIRPHFGATAEFICVDAAMVVAVPNGVSSRDAACLPLNYLTAHAMLHQDGKATSGQTVCVQSAAGGVGSALVQLAVRAGLKVYGVASDGKHQLVRELGATPLTRGAFATALRRHEPQGVDLLCDSVGPSGIDESLTLVKPGGTVVSYGFMGEGQRTGLARLLGLLRVVLWLPLVSRARRFRFFGNLPTRAVKQPAWFQATLTELLGQVRDGAFKPVIAGEFPLEQVGDAQALLESGKAVGKVLVRVAR
jgi:NADPH:quinone reductase-like Zn-dependent oxidoreductase